MYPNSRESTEFVPKNINRLCLAKCNKHTALPGVVTEWGKAFVPTPLSCLKIVRKIASFESAFSRNQVISHHIFRCSLVNTSTLGNVSLISLPEQKFISKNIFNYLFPVPVQPLLQTAPAVGALLIQSLEKINNTETKAKPTPLAWKTYDKSYDKSM